MSSVTVSRIRLDSATWSLVTHRIQTTSGFTPPQMRQYRVPETIKPEVDRQIDELLKLGLIRPSTSPMASPIVCVSKKMVECVSPATTGT